VVNTGILAKVLSSLLISSNASIAQKSCWLVSNVLAGTEQQIQAVIDAGLPRLVFESLLHADNQTTDSRPPGLWLTS